MLVGAYKIQIDVLDVRLPIHRELKDILLDRIKNFYLNRGQVFLCKLYRALISTGYHGLFRVRELKTGTHPILATNIHAAKKQEKIPNHTQVFKDAHCG